MASITTVISDNDLKVGDAMRDVQGERIPDSVVVGPSAWAMLDDGSCMIENHGVISGEVTRITIGHEGAAALAKLMGADEIHVATFDGSTISSHRSAAGAVRAATDHMAERMARLGNSTLTRDDIDMIATVLEDCGVLDLQIRRDLGTAVPYMSVERVHAIAMGVSGTYEIRSSALLD